MYLLCNNTTLCINIILVMLHYCVCGSFMRVLIWNREFKLMFLWYLKRPYTLSWHFIYCKLKWKPFWIFITKMPHGHVSSHLLLHGFRVYAEHLADFVQLCVSHQRFLFQVLVAHAKFQQLSQQSHLVLLLLNEKTGKRAKRGVDEQNSQRIPSTAVLWHCLWH